MISHDPCLKLLVRNTTEYVVKWHVVSHVWVPCRDVRYDYDFRVKRCSVCLDPHLCCRDGSCFMYVIFIYNIYVEWCPYHIMFVSFSSNTTCVICGAGFCNPYWAPYIIFKTFVQSHNDLIVVNCIVKVYDEMKYKKVYCKIQDRLSQNDNADTIYKQTN